MRDGPTEHDPLMVGRRVSSTRPSTERTGPDTDVTASAAAAAPRIYSTEREPGHWQLRDALITHFAHRSPVLERWAQARAA